MKKVTMITIATIGIFAVGAVWALGTENSPPEGAMSVEDLAAKALTQYDGEVEDVEFETEDGKHYAFVEIEMSNHKEVYVVLDPITGEVLESYEDDCDHDDDDRDEDKSYDDSQSESNADDEGNAST